MSDREQETLSDIVAEIRRDKTPYVLKVAAALDNASGDKVLNDDAAKCLRDDCDYTSGLADRIEAAQEREKKAYGGARPDEVAKLLQRVHDWLGVVIRDGHCDDHCSECIGASDLADDVYDVLQKMKTEEGAK